MIEAQKILMGQMTWPRPYEGRFVVRRLWNLESLRSPITKMHNATKNVEIEVV